MLQPQYYSSWCTTCHILSHRVKSCHKVPHRVTSRHMVLHRVTSKLVFAMRVLKNSVNQDALKSVYFAHIHSRNISSSSRLNGTSEILVFATPEYQTLTLEPPRNIRHRALAPRRIIRSSALCPRGTSEIL